MKHVLVAIFVCVALLTFSNFALAAPVAGDIDLSGGVDGIDVQLVINAALGLPALSHTDISYDAAMNAVDVQLEINATLGIEIDSDSDGLCDAAEIAIGTNPDLDNTDSDGTNCGDNRTWRSVNTASSGIPRRAPTILSVSIVTWSAA